MSQAGNYRVILLDAEGYEISDCVADTLKESKVRMKYMLSEQYANAGETTHERMGTHKVEVHNSKGECIVDCFYE